MRCDHCVELLDRFADRELSDNEVAEVRQHLAACPPCEHRFKFHSDLKRLVRTCCSETTAPEHLRAKLQEILF